MPPPRTERAPRPPRPPRTTIPAGALTNAQRDAALRSLADRLTAVETDTDDRLTPAAADLRDRLDTIRGAQ